MVETRCLRREEGILVLPQSSKVQKYFTKPKQLFSIILSLKKENRKLINITCPV
jgi:hypothetical protein